MSKKKKSNVKLEKMVTPKRAIILGVVILFVVLLVLIYKNLFSSSNGNRYKGIENYKLTSAEKDSVKEKLNELGKVKNVKIYVKSKIIRIFVNLSEDVDFDTVKNVSNSLLEGFSEENLSYYDVEIFYESDNKESIVYPQIGYKHKSKTEFSW